MNVAFRIPIEFANALPTGSTRKAVDTLGRWIADDVFTPDARMPMEDELANSLGVSRTTVRDAIKVLSGKGLVRTARRYGTRVLPVDEWNLLDRDVVGWHRADHPRMRRIFAETTELRVIMEPAAAAIAAERATEAQIETLRRAAYAIEPERHDLQALFEADCLFHVTLLDATQNQVMRQMRQIILTMLRVSYEYGVSKPQNKPVNRLGHINVAEAIANRDGESAHRAMSHMLEQNQDLVAEYRHGNDRFAV